MLNNIAKKSMSVFVTSLIVLASFSAFCEDEQETRQSARRDPFVPLVGVETTKTKSGIDGILTIIDVKFQGIATGTEGKKAIILNGELIEEGDTVGLVKVEEVGVNKARISIDGALHDISLYEHRVQ